MYAAALRSDPVEAAAAALRQRAQGRVALGVQRFGSGTRPVHIAESGSARVRLPRCADVLEAVLINTAGGVCGGDRFGIDVSAGPGARMVLATAAAEKVYRSDGPEAEVAVQLSLAPASELSWLAQETILYNRARLRRRFEVDLAANARLLLFEAVVFGRAAHGEEVIEGLLEDRWRIRSEGRLVYADTLRLAGPIASLLDRPAVAGGGRALATLLYVTPDAEGRIEEARACLEGSASECGASAWNGLLAVRFVARDAKPLRSDAVRFIQRFRGAPLPRVWQT